MSDILNQFTLDQVCEIDPRGERIKVAVEKIIQNKFFPDSRIISEIQQILKEIRQEFTLDNVSIGVDKKMIENRLQEEDSSSWKIAKEILEQKRRSSLSLLDTLIIMKQLDYEDIKDFYKRLEAGKSYHY